MNASGPHSHLTVLFVDDEDKARKYFARAFSREFNVLTAASVKEAQQLLDEHGDEVALLLTDQRMPAGDGVSLLTEVRERFPSIIRLITTAYADMEDAIAAVNRGEVRRYITKPWNLEELRNELREALELYRRQEHERELLEERRKSMFSVASHIAHEMRTPLLTIRSAAVGLERYLPRLMEGYRWAVEHDAPIEPMRDGHVKALEDAAEGIQRVVDRANSVIDVLLVNCGGKGVDPSTFETCSMADCVDAALRDYPFQAHEYELIDADTSKDFTFHGSKALMVFTLHNLLRNSLRSIAAAGKGRIEIWTLPGDTANLLHVKDTAQGIPPEVRPKIFQDFASFSGNGGGVGIGLGFCTRVLESFGGHIQCDSEPDVFARFDLSFPPTADEAATD